MMDIRVAISFLKGFLVGRESRSCFAVQAQGLSCLYESQERTPCEAAPQGVGEREAQKQGDRNMGAMRALLAVARKNTHKPHKYKNLVRQKARGYAGQ